MNCGWGRRDILVQLEGDSLCACDTWCVKISPHKTVYISRELSKSYCGCNSSCVMGMQTISVLWRFSSGNLLHSRQDLLLMNGLPSTTSAFEWRQSVGATCSFAWPKQLLIPLQSYHLLRSYQYMGGRGLILFRRLRLAFFYQLSWKRSARAWEMFVVSGSCDLVWRGALSHLAESVVG